MTIEDIKEWWNTAITHDKHAMIDAIDTLLAEVATLEKHNAYADQYNAVQDLHLTIATSQLAVATEALKLILEETEDSNTISYARTALERIKE